MSTTALKEALPEVVKITVPPLIDNGSPFAFDSITVIILVEVPSATKVDGAAIIVVFTFVGSGLV